MVKVQMDGLCVIRCASFKEILNKGKKLYVTVKSRALYGMKITHTKKIGGK